MWDEKQKKELAKYWKGKVEHKKKGMKGFRYFTDDEIKANMKKSKTNQHK